MDNTFKLSFSFRAFALALTLMVLLFSCSKDTDNDQNEIPIYAVEIGDSQIPYVQINTGIKDILNEPKVAAEMKIWVEDSKIFSGNIGIEYRGSTSFRISHKKSFGIETWDENGNDIDVSFFGFPEEEDWIINGHVVNIDNAFIFDRTLMYHQFGYQLSRKMGRYAAGTQFVELEINGIYQGVYVFMEKLKRDRNRIDISTLGPEDITDETITGGYILKIDKTAGGDHSFTQPLEYFNTNWDDDARYTEDISFRSQYDIYGNLMDLPPFDPPYHSSQYLETYFLYEYPDADEITQAQKEYIEGYIHQFETSLLSDNFDGDIRTYTDYIDVSSFVDYFILNEVVRNVDGYRLSTYIHKDRNGKLNMGPVWDLNIGYDTGDRVPWDDWVINYNQFVQRDAWMMPFWWPRLLEDPLFKSAIKQRWNSLRADILSTASLHNMVDETADYLLKNGGINRNYIKWDIGMPVDYQASIESLKSFLEFRTEWMDQQIASY